MLGADFVMPANASMSASMTVTFCLEACASMKSENGSSYEFVALGDGRYVSLTHTETETTITDTQIQ